MRSMPETRLKIRKIQSGLDRSRVKQLKESWAYVGSAGLDDPKLKALVKQESIRQRKVALTVRNFRQSAVGIQSKLRTVIRKNQLLTVLRLYPNYLDSQKEEPHKPGTDPRVRTLEFIY